MTERKFVETEEVDLASRSDILPFCVYHWVDPAAGTYVGYLSGPTVVRNKEGKLMYKCTEPNSLNPYGRWSLAFTFYAVNPMVRPIPNGMALFCAKRRDTFPWDTRQIDLVYDPYDENDGCVYFIAYTKPVPWTKPLYVHIQGTVDFPQTSFPTWSPNPPVSDDLGKYVKQKTKFFSTQPTYKWEGNPSEEAKIEDTGLDEGDRTSLGWHHPKLFPFYVLSPDLFGPDYHKIRFVCHDATCLPYNPNNDYINEVSVTNNTRFRKEKPRPRRLRDCVVRCNQLVPNELGGGEPFNLLSLINLNIDAMESDAPSLKDRISNVSHVVIAVLLAILVTTLGLLMYLSLRKK